MLAPSAVTQVNLLYFQPPLPNSATYPCEAQVPLNSPTYHAFFAGTTPPPTQEQYASALPTQQQNAVGLPVQQKCASLLAVLFQFTVVLSEPLRKRVEMYNQLQYDSDVHVN